MQRRNIIWLFLLSCSAAFPAFSAFSLEGDVSLDVIPNALRPGGIDSQVHFRSGEGTCFSALGFGPDCSGSVGWLGDSWSRSCNASYLGNWTKGSGICIGNATSTVHFPGGRSGALLFAQNDSHILFGGFGSGRTKTKYEGKLADAWLWDGFSWNFVVESPPDIEAVGRYGTLGVEDSSNWPGGRVGSVTWNDGDSQYIALGWGLTDAPGARGGLSDVWKVRLVNGSTLLWTWVYGPKTLNNLPSEQMISGRYGACSWFNELTSCFFSFGGFGWDSNHNLGHLGDMYSFCSDESGWRRLSSGPTIGNLSPTYGKLGIEKASNFPGGRYGSIALPAVANDLENLYFFGGSLSSGENYADVWRFNVKSYMFTWVGGPQGTGFLGNKTWPSGRYGSNVFRLDNFSFLFSNGFGHGLRNGKQDVGGLSDWWLFEKK